MIYMPRLESNVTVLNASTGLKHLISKSVAIKYEINHRKYKYPYRGHGQRYSSVDSTTITNISFFIGLSLLLN